MAFAGARLAILVLAVAILSFNTEARPCKTIFISYTLSSSSSSSSASSFAGAGDVEVTGAAAEDHIPTIRVVGYRIVRLRPSFLVRRRPIQIDRQEAITAAPAAGGLSSSLEARARDILFVVVSLLFGVGCGALTAAVLYLAWSFVGGCYNGCSGDEYDLEAGGEDESPKKMGYVTIEDEGKKEGYEGN